MRANMRHRVHLNPNSNPNPNSGKSLWYCIYFVVWIVLGNYFLLNLVLATLLSRSQDVVAKKVIGRDHPRS